VSLAIQSKANARQIHASGPRAAAKSSAWRKPQQPADHRGFAAFRLGIHLERHLAAAQRRGVDRAALEPGVALGEIVEAAIGELFVKLDGEALIRLGYAR
jgi:hypothetical protein